MVAPNTPKKCNALRELVTHQVVGTKTSMISSWSVSLAKPTTSLSAFVAKIVFHVIRSDFHLPWNLTSWIYPNMRSSRLYSLALSELGSFSIHAKTSGYEVLLTMVKLLALAESFAHVRPGKISSKILVGPHTRCHTKYLQNSNSKFLAISSIPSLDCLLPRSASLHPTAGLELDTHLCTRLERLQRPLSAEPPLAIWWTFAICLLGQ